ncbi:MAG: restriction endonuclease subunit S [Bacteroidales bacterium]|nr:restriction endonuclease subunit S [Bacteroidales bacterium]
MEVRIGDCIECNPTVKLTKGIEYPLIDIDKITVGRKLVTNKETIVYDKQSGCKFQNGDTLMARITPCLENGKMAMVSVPDKGIGSTEFFVFRGKKDVTDNEFVYYFLRQQYIRNLAANSMSGASGRQRADLKYIKKIKFDLPTLPTQQKIASILSTYDNLIENNTKRIRLLEQMAENLYKEWFVRFRFPGHENVEMERGVPKGWSIAKLKEIVKRLPFNRTYKEFELKQEGNVIVIDQSTKGYLGFHNNEPSHIATLDAPIIIFGDHSCKFQLMIKNFSLGENVIPFVSNDEERTNRYYLFYATHKLIETEEYKRHWGRLMAMKVLIPNIKLQQEFSEIIKIMENDKEYLQRQIALLTKQRDLLLPRLMSGKLEVKP